MPGARAHVDMRMSLFQCPIGLALGGVGRLPVNNLLLRRPRTIERTSESYVAGWTFTALHKTPAIRQPHPAAIPLRFA